jgi:hypothetical protein
VKGFEGEAVALCVVDWLVDLWQESRLIYCMELLHGMMVLIRAKFQAFLTVV